jgi:hypothetical protein
VPRVASLPVAASPPPHLDQGNGISSSPNPSMVVVVLHLLYLPPESECIDRVFLNAPPNPSNISRFVSLQNFTKAYAFVLLVPCVRIHPDGSE